ncbi:MAG: amidohydrolase family protein [Actinomycetales bacterium]|nr:amidohydrolase family protein [Actinomycetales bacterium]
MTSTLYRGGVIHSPADPFAQALLVDDGVVTWLGDEDTAAHVKADEVIELDGALVAPAFVDAHVHVLETGFALEGLDLGGAKTLAQALAAVERAATRVRADGGTLVLGHSWDETGWPEGRGPTADELDRASGGLEVYLSRVDVHSAAVSGALAAAAGLAERPGWSPEGLVRFEAHHAARGHARRVAPERRTALYRSTLEAAAAQGIVSVHEQSAPHVDTREGLAELLALTADASSALPQVIGYRAELCETVDDARAVLEALPGLTGIGGDLNVDGAIGSRSAALRSAYADDAENRGELFLTAEQITNHLTAVTRAGVHSGFHIIGDRAMDEYLLGLEAAASVEGIPALSRAGHRIEHAEMLDARALATLVLHGVRLSVQPAFDASWGGQGGMYARRLGSLRASGLNPFADLVSAGIPIALGSDAPVTPFDPWGAVRAGVYHHEAEQRITARAAFRAHTRGGWRLAGLDHTGAGELRVGSPAHLAVWRSDALMVQVPEGSVPTWSTDARAGTPLLPDLSDPTTRPECLRTVRHGVPLFDTFG